VRAITAHWQYIFAVIVAVVVAYAAWRFGKRAGGQYRDAVRNRQQWRNDLAAKSQASAVATNNVQVNVDNAGHRQNELDRPREFWLPTVIRPGLDSGPDRGQEAVVDGDDGSVRATVGDGGPANIRGLIFGARNTRVRHDASSSSGVPSGDE
jgi:hypothetical protein